MTELPVTADYRRLFLEQVPLIDVRAPIEFQQGAFPAAVNLPLLNDAERHRIGIHYKQRGQGAAIELGHQLVSGTVKQSRVAAWRRFAETHPEGALYCFRGGLRSRLSQQWLAEAGIVYLRVQGGYKALRRFLLAELERAADWRLVVIGGRTGSAKTRLIRSLPTGIDLEGLANHRGSAFGQHITPQPPPVDFENALAIALLRLRNRGKPGAVLEDESANVGRLTIPQSLYRAAQRAPLVVLEVPLAKRIDEILNGYVHEMSAAFASAEGAAGIDQFSRYLLNSLGKLRRRLGGARHQQLERAMRSALERQRCTGELVGHRDWIAVLLQDYYDPMYDYQLARKADRIAFRGDRAAVLGWLAARGFTANHSVCGGVPQTA